MIWRTTLGLSQDASAGRWGMGGHLTDENHGCGVARA